MISHTTITTDDVDELFSWSQGWDFEIVQLSPGALGFRAQLLALPGVTLRWEYWGQRLRSCHLNHSENLSVGFLLAAKHAPVWKGREVSLGQALVFGSDEQEYVSPADMCSLNIEIARDLLDAWGLAAPAGGLVDVEPAALRSLLAECRRASALAQLATSMTDSCAALITRERILARLVEALGGADMLALTVRRTANQERRFALIKGAEAAALASTGDLDCAGLAAELHTSYRSLHRIIKEWSGAGPQMYFQLLRLHRLRRQLLSGSTSEESITATAHALGFENMGRLARLYRCHFGELPRDTRRRARA